jgi:hypothetical protein
MPNFAPDHVQVPFSLATGKFCLVDEGLYDILTKLKELGVVTRYSCEDNRDHGYVQTTGRSSRKLEKITKRLYSRGELSDETFELVESFILGDRELEVFTYLGKINRYVKLRYVTKRKTGYVIERDWSPRYGYRNTYRWPVEHSALLLRALTEILEKAN